MPVTVRVYATLIEELGKREVTLPFRQGETVADMLRRSGVYSLVVENGRVKSLYKVLLNGRDIEFLEGLDTKVRDGDVIDVFPPAAGG